MLPRLTKKANQMRDKVVHFIEVVAKKVKLIKVKVYLVVLNFKNPIIIIRDVTLSLFSEQRTKFTLFDFVFPKTLEMISRHL